MATAPDRPWTLAELAARVHYSPYFLTRLFRRLTGYSIAGYRQQLRLRLSLEQALRPAADLSAIAAGYGFSSHSHYTRAFRQAFGCTPSQARVRSGAHHVDHVGGGTRDEQVRPAVTVDVAQPDGVVAERLARVASGVVEQHPARPSTSRR